MTHPPLVPRPVSLDTLPRALGSGWQVFKQTARISCGFAAIFAAIGLALLITLGVNGLTPLALPLAGGFMLVGPPLLSGYFNVARLVEAGNSPRFRDLFAGLRGTPHTVWVIALVCMLLFMIWITDAAVMYSFMIGRAPVLVEDILPRGADIAAFEFYGSLMGTALAFAIYTISAFSVPLLFEGRATLIGAVSASVRAVFDNLRVSLPWAAILASAVMASILVLPLFIIVMPWLAYASFRLYREVFPL
jgi:uncharacterized membrane protein